MIGVSISLTLKDQECEKAFLEIFQKALEKISSIEGLLEFIPSKVIGKDYSYHIFSLWESEDAIEKWLSNPAYKAIREKSKIELIKNFISYRWMPLREPKKFGFEN